MEHPPRNKRMSIMALDELKRRDDLESLRRYLIAESCFPAQKDPETAPITMEELKKLARVWKLNERRNFWKTHTDRDEIVATLLHHASQNKNYVAKKSASVEIHKPAPPAEIRPSSAGTKVTALSRNYYGLKYFNRENNPTELVISSRFFAYPNPDDSIDNVVDHWRSDDFNMKDDTQSNNGNQASNGQGSNRNSTAITGQSTSSNASGSSSNRHMNGIRNKVKLMKQRNLAMHLMNYSANLDFKKTTFNVKSVQTFINVAESDDPKTVSHCIIALSNIASDAHVRSILFEINAVHKITNILQYLRGKQAAWAAGLLFYYFSIDKEAEDRVYNASASLLQANGGSKDLETRLVALYTLNNLMPCIDRQRVAEIIMKILFQQFEGSVLREKQIWSTYLTIMLNMSWFTNAHATLMANQILDLLSHFSKFASAERNPDMAIQVAKVLLAFLQLPDQASNLVSTEFVNVLIPLIHEQMPEQSLTLALKVAVVLSTVPALRRTLRPTQLTSTIADMIIRRGTNLTANLAKDCSKYLCNISLSDPPPPLATTATPSAAAAAAALAMSFRGHDEDLEKLVTDGVPDAIFALVKSNSLPQAVKSTAIRGLQNIVSHSTNAVALAAVCLEPVMKFLKDSHDLGAAEVLYNLSCIPECRADLVHAKIHNIVLDHFQSTKEANGALKSVFLQILVQLSSSDICVMELLRLDLVTKLENQLKTSSKLIANWKDISLMLLAVVAYAIQSISDSDLLAIVRILKTICVIGVEDEVVENCANVIKFISGYFWDFNELNPVIRAILELNDSEEVIDCISSVLYNITGHTENILPMLSDSSYLNVMIRLMRSGKADVQENIIQAISTLCSNEKCTQLLLKHDILSDLIVIALLRTSSEEIKVICSQAFYNMLCHVPTRLDLVKGDLWWALMRLGRTDSRTVQSICIKALCDLSYPPMDPSHATGHGTHAARAKISTSLVQAQYQRIMALRQHNILSFIKDLSTSAHADDLIKCMQILHNLLSQFVELDTTNAASINMASTPKYNFTETEIIASIRLTADAIVRAPNLKTIRVALLVLLKCAQQHQFDKVFSEFLLIDIIETLKTQRNNWNQHPDCRLNVSRLLYELTKSKIFTKASSVVDLNVICMAIVERSESGDGTKASSTAPSLEIIENLAAVFLQFSLAENISPHDLVKLSIWPLLLQEGLSTDSTVVAKSTANSFAQTPGRRMPSMLLNSSTSAHSPHLTAMHNAQSPSKGTGGNARKSLYLRESSMTTGPAGDAIEMLRGPTPSAFRLQGMVLSLLSYTIDALLATAQGLKQLTTHLLQGLLRADLIDHLWTRNNLLSILHAVSQSTHCIPALLVPETFQLLLRYLNTSVGTIRHEKAQEFAATFLRNVVLHSAYVSRLIAISHNALNDFVKDVCEEIQSPDTALDMAIFFFHTANYLMQSESNLNPKFVLDMITKLSTNEKLSSEVAVNNETVSNIQNINKYTLSMILNKYSFAQGVDPSFVQNMLSYMQSPAMALIPDLMRSLDFKTLADWKGSLVGDFLMVKESVFVDLLVFYPETAIWIPVTHSSSKQINSVILKFTQPVSLEYERLEGVEALPSSIFAKIVRQFEPVMEGGKGDHQAITENDDGDDLPEEGDDADYRKSVAATIPDNPEVGTVLSVEVTNAPSMGSTDSVEKGSAEGVDVELTGSIRSSMGNAILASAMAALRIAEEDEYEAVDPATATPSAQPPVDRSFAAGSAELEASAEQQTMTVPASTTEEALQVLTDEVEQEMVRGASNAGSQRSVGAASNAESQRSVGGASNGESQRSISQGPPMPVTEVVQINAVLAGDELGESAAEDTIDPASTSMGSRPARSAGSRSRVSASGEEMDYSNSFEEVSGSGQG